MCKAQLIFVENNIESQPVSFLIKIESQIEEHYFVIFGDNRRIRNFSLIFKFENA